MTSKEKSKKEKSASLIVKCPGCSSTYHLCELAMPGELIGKPKAHGLIKDGLGTILYIDWEEEPVREFRYCCDNCGKEFIVEANISLRVKAVPAEEDFSDLSVSLL